MRVIAREFERGFGKFKQLADAGQIIEITDRRGQVYTFAARRQESHAGAGRHLAGRRPLAPDPVPESEWRGLR